MDSVWIDIEQNTDEWMILRTGKLTCSQFEILFMKESTKGFQRLIREKAFERLTGEQIPDKWQGNAATEQGHEREAKGIELYEAMTFQKVHPGGFYIYNENIGGSPDGIVGEDGLIEVKSRTTEVWLESIEGFKPSRAEHWQCVGQMLVSGRKWVDLVYTPPHEMFNPIIHRIERNETEITELKNKLNYVNGLIEVEIKKLKQWMK